MVGSAQKPDFLEIASTNRRIRLQLMTSDPAIVSIWCGLIGADLGARARTDLYAELGEIAETPGALMFP